MKKFLIIAGCIIVVIAAGCDKARRGTGHAYMPDMAYSVAYETYAPAQERLDKYGAHFNSQPVAGSIAREDMLPYSLKSGDTSGYYALVNPLPAPDEKNMLEATRLYLVNCAICHGNKLDGNGPLYKDGAGPFTAKPANLMTSKASDGKMFHVVTYGLNAMGSYASQLNTKQRWMIISYIKEKQKGTGSTATQTVPDSNAVKTPVVDSANAAKNKGN